MSSDIYILLFIVTLYFDVAILFGCVRIQVTNKAASHIENREDKQHDLTNKVVFSFS